MSPCTNKEKRILRISLCIAAAVIAITAAAVSFAMAQRPVCLVLRNADTGKRIAVIALPEDRTFSVRFLHSVNRSPVEEIYEARETELYVTGCIYESLGAGVETAAGEGEQMLIGPDEELRYTGIERRVDPLVYIVGTWSDHELIVGDTAISLTELCGKNAKVLFEAKRSGKGEEAETIKETATPARTVEETGGRR